MKPDAPTPTVQTPEASMPSSPAAAAPPALAVRPKLNLAKRSVSNAPDETPTSASDSKASPFGAARPIDTATREAEIEKKREEARVAKEAEDKAKAEKAEKAAAENPAQQQQPPSQQRKSSNRNSMPPPARTGSEQNGAGRRGPRNGQPPANAAEGESAEPEQREQSRFALLNPDDEGEGADGAVDASANGNIVDDKAVKPKEIVQEPGKGPAADTAEALQGDGWSTVPATKSRGHRRGFSQAPGRSLAS